MADPILLPLCARCGLTLVEVYSSPPLTLRKPCHDNRQHQWSETIEVVPLFAAGGTGEREEAIERAIEQLNRMIAAFVSPQPALYRLERIRDDLLEALASSSPVSPAGREDTSRG